jgi:hypothetical protein
MQIELTNALVACAAGSAAGIAAGIAMAIAGFSYQMGRNRGRGEVEAAADEPRFATVMERIDSNICAMRGTVSRLEELLSAAGTPVFQLDLALTLIADSKVLYGQINGQVSALAAIAGRGTHGIRCCIARGLAEEAALNARLMEASRVVYAGLGRRIVPAAYRDHPGLHWGGHHDMALASFDGWDAFVWSGSGGWSLSASICDETAFRRGDFRTAVIHVTGMESGGDDDDAARDAARALAEGLVTNVNEVMRNWGMDRPRRER